MRTRTLVLVALLTLPAGLSAQVRLPRGGRTNPTPKAPLPPEAPAVTRALAYKRSRWSVEAYPVLSAIQTPNPGGGGMSSTSLGAGTRADYRYTDYFSATLDLTASLPGSSTQLQTVEVGTRYRPMPWSEELRPFLDVRAGYVRLNETFTDNPGGSVPVQQFVAGERYGRGFGGVMGAGLEHSLTPRWALTTELSAMRNRMSTYRLTTPAGLPLDSGKFWMTMYRFTLGLKYNPTVLRQADKRTQ